ncbi:MAG TPA: Ig-like domain-containing protein, partial [Anaerolineales bacterium]
VGGTGTCNAIFLTAGTKLLTVTYSGDAIYSPSSGTASHTVSKGDSTTAFNGLPLPSTSPYTSFPVSVKVTGAGGNPPTGSVSFSISGGQASTCTATIDSLTQNATCNLSITAVGTYTITAIYNGDANHWSSSSTANKNVN